MGKKFIDCLYLDIRVFRANSKDIKLHRKVKMDTNSRLSFGIELICSSACKPSESKDIDSFREESYRSSSGSPVNFESKRSSSVSPLPFYVPASYLSAFPPPGRTI